MTGLMVGNIFAIFTFFAILMFDFYRMLRLMSRLYPAQLGAYAGGWNLALRTPLNLCVISIAFGIGMWLGVRATGPKAPSVPPQPSPAALPHP